MITISENVEEEMVQISNGDKVLFNGNYWDLPADAEDMVTFLRELGLEISYNKDLPPIG